MLSLMGGSPEPTTNDMMVNDMIAKAVLRTKECIAAFRTIDRKYFWIEEHSQCIYSDCPQRFPESPSRDQSRLHISAPQIYAFALESLWPMALGMSFLAVGSGTGYFSSVVSELIGPLATNHGIDIWPEVLVHAAKKCKGLGKSGIQFFLGNVYELDVHKSMRYDRIYVGACANWRSKYLYRLLEVGGILVGPFQAGRHQHLRRVVRLSELEFSSEILESVCFANLVEPEPRVEAAATLGGQRKSCTGTFDVCTPQSHVSIGSPTNGRFGFECDLLSVPGAFTFSLNERPWAPERCGLYPCSFRLAVKAFTSGPLRDSHAYTLPREIWLLHIFPWCPRWWFDQRRVSLVPSSAGCRAQEVEIKTLDRIEEDLSEAGALFETRGSKRFRIGSSVDPDKNECSMFYIGPRVVSPDERPSFTPAPRRQRIM